MKKENDILKWFNNELSEKEIQDLQQSEDLKTLEKIAHYSTHLNAPTVNAKKALEAFKERSFNKKTDSKVRTLNFKLYYRVAAMLAIMLSASYFMFFNNNKSFETQIAQTQTLLLPDNSEVILNSKSKLSYNKKSWKENRSLELEGEAFFKVEKGQKFTVNTDAGMVQVLGTQFNVKERDNYFEVQCYEGLVGVTYDGKTTKLTPGKTYRVIDGSVQTVDDFNSINPSWLQDESNFVKVPLQQVITELERQYNIKVTLNDIDTTQLFSGTFTHNDINIALKAVTIPLELSYKLEEKKVTLIPYEGN